MKYFELLNLETLEVYVTQDLKVQPINSLPFFANEFSRAGFNKYPNPTKIVELGAIPIPIEQLEQMQLEEIKNYDSYFFKKIRTGEEIPQEVLDELEKIDQKYNDLKRN